MREQGTDIPRAWLADRWWPRFRGLLGRPPLARDGSQALVLTPCASVHTVGMRYPLDLVFLDRHQCVLAWREYVTPWRARACKGAVATIELHGGALRDLAPELHERWVWQPDVVTTEGGIA
ncbi:DUF192 domain-containing protein [Lysobacter korlensis]|uniref:DUF192 domain-containing protein n=1 Tax=Lysobacter korlensis TaxID=553636 RepID=A0ABV6RHV1_9GAMM